MWRLWFSWRRLWMWCNKFDFDLIWICWGLRSFVCVFVWGADGQSGCVHYLCQMCCKMTTAPHQYYQCHPDRDKATCSHGDSSQRDHSAVALYWWMMLVEQKSFSHSLSIHLTINFCSSKDTIRVAITVFRNVLTKDLFCMFFTNTFCFKPFFYVYIAYLKLAWDHIYYLLNMYIYIFL